MNSWRRLGIPGNWSHKANVPAGLGRGEVDGQAAGRPAGVVSGWLAHHCRFTHAHTDADTHTAAVKKKMDRSSWRRCRVLEVKNVNSVADTQTIYDTGSQAYIRCDGGSEGFLVPSMCLLLWPLSLSLVWKGY